MKNRHLIRIFYLAALWPLFAFSPQTSSAFIRVQSVAGRDSLNARVWNRPERLPKLNGHRFFSTTTIPTPFITTRIGISTGGGLVEDLRFTLNHPETGEELTSLRGDLAFLISRIFYQQALSDRISLFLDTNVLTRLATHEQSILTQGITAVLGYKFGVRGKIWSNERFYISASGAFSRSTLIGITPLLFLKKVIEEGFDPDDDNDLIRTELSGRLNGSLEFAYSPIPFLGFIAHASAGAASPFEDNDEKIPVSSFGLSTHADFGALSHVPLGLTFGVITDSLSPAANDFARRTRSYIIGISFTGREDMDLGLEIATASINQSDVKDKFSASVASFHLNYFF